MNLLCSRDPFHERVEIINITVEIINSGARLPLFEPQITSNLYLGKLFTFVSV